jgi:hypothetical protein
VPPPDWTRPLGSTGLQVTAIGLGLAALGRPGYLNLGHGTDLGEDRSIDALRSRVDTMAEPPERYWQSRSALQWT